jgi:hypothetical protein
VRPFGLGNRAFDSYVVYFSVLVSALSLGVKVGIGVSSNCENCAMGGEGFGLLQGLLDLWLRQWWWVCFGLDLGIGIIWHRVCDLSHGRRVCHLGSWWRLRMVSCGIMI